jgi:hypothetical protein
MTMTKRPKLLPDVLKLTGISRSDGIPHNTGIFKLGSN